ncbi:Polyadenylation and cleavage factor-like protein 11, partial [Stegodyphus mimosarum]
MKNHEFSNPQKLSASLEHEINFLPQTMKFKKSLPLPSAVKPFKLDNKMRLVHFVDNKALVVLDNNEPRKLTFEGGPREVYVEGLAEPIILGFDGKPVEFEVNGKRHSMKFGTPAREIYINDYPYEAKFGGPPFEAMLDDGRIYNIRLSGPPPQVVVGDKPEYELFAKIQGGNDPLHKKSEFSDSKMETKYQFSESSSGSVLQDVDMRIKPENMKMLQDSIPGDNDMKDVDWRKIPPLNEAASTMSQPKIWSVHENWKEDKTDLSDVRRNLNKREIGQVSVDRSDRQQMKFDDVSSVHRWKEPPSYSDIKLGENLHNAQPHHEWENIQPYEQSDKVNWAHKDYRESRILGGHHPKADDTDHLEHVSSIHHTEHNCSSDIQHPEHSSVHYPIDGTSTTYHEHASAVHHLEHSSTALQAEQGSDSHHSKHGFVHTERVPLVYHSENKPLYHHEHEPSTYHPEHEPPVLHSKGEPSSHHHQRGPLVYHPEPRLAVDHSECSPVKHHVEHGPTIHHTECGPLLPHLEHGSGIHHSEHNTTRHNLEHDSTMHQSEHGPALHYMEQHPALHHPEQAPAIHHAKHAVATHPQEQVHNSEYGPTMPHTQGPAVRCLEQEAPMHHLKNNPPIHQPEQIPTLHHPELGSIHISQGNNPEHLESNLYEYDSRHIHQRMSCPPSRPPFFNHRVRLRLRGVRYGAGIHPNFRERSHDLFIGSSRRPLLRDPQPQRYIRPPRPLLPLPRFHVPDSVSRG